MRVKQMAFIHRLRPIVLEQIPDAQYISSDIVVDRKPGRFLGFDIGNGVRIGVYSERNSNTARIITRGTLEEDNDEMLAKAEIVMRELQNMGFSGR